MRNIMEKIMNKRDVILSRGIWYVITLLSLFGLSISINLLWPHGDSSKSSGFLRDGAVSATTFYAVTLFRYLFLTDHSTCYKKFTTKKQKAPQCFFSVFTIYVVFLWPQWYSLWVKKKVSSVWYMSLFTISFVNGGIGLIQLSNKFRMEMRHALLTLLCVWLCSLSGHFEALYFEGYKAVAWFLLLLAMSCLVWIGLYDCPEDL